jgi:hypothetical protein
MTRSSRLYWHRIVAGIVSTLLAASPGATIPRGEALAQESEPTSEDTADDGDVADWILRLFRGSDESDDGTSEDRDRFGKPSSGDQGGGGNGGDDGGGDDGGGDDGGGDDGGEGGEGGGGKGGGEGEGGNDD